MQFIYCVSRRLAKRNIADADELLKGQTSEIRVCATYGSTE